MHSIPPLLPSAGLKCACFGLQCCPPPEEPPHNDACACCRGKSLTNNLVGQLGKTYFGRESGEGATGTEGTPQSDWCSKRAPSLVKHFELAKKNERGGVKGRYACERLSQKNNQTKAPHGAIAPPPAHTHPHPHPHTRARLYACTHAATGRKEREENKSGNRFKRVYYCAQACTPCHTPTTYTPNRITTQSAAILRKDRLGTYNQN